MAESNQVPPINPDEINGSPETTEINQEMKGPPNGGSGSGSTTSSTKIGSTLDSLRKAAPKVYNLMMEGIAMSICNKMKDAQDRIKEINRKAQQDS